MENAVTFEISAIFTVGMMLGYHVLLLLGFCCFHVTADGIDDEMNDLASDIGDSIRSIRYDRVVSLPSLNIRDSL